MNTDLIWSMLFGAATQAMLHPVQGVASWLAATFIVVVMLPSILTLFPVKGFKKIPAAAFSLWLSMCVVFPAKAAARIAMEVAKATLAILCWMFDYTWERAMPGARRSKRKRKVHTNRDHEDEEDHDDTDGDGEDHDEH